MRVQSRLSLLLCVLAISTTCVVLVQGNNNLREWSASDSSSGGDSSSSSRGPHNSTNSDTVVSSNSDDGSHKNQNGGDEETPSFDDVVRCPQSKVHSAYNDIGKDQSSFKYPSTTIAYSVIAVQSLIFGIIILAKYDGLHIFTVAGGVDSSREGYVAVHTDEDFKIDRKKMRVRATDNRFWAAYFFTLFLQFATRAVVLQLKIFEDNKEALRIGTLVVRVLLGLSCCLLTVNLIFQRIYRTRDHAQGGVNQVRVRQGKIALAVCGVLYLLYVAGEFIASHLFESLSHVVVDFLFWCYIVALIFINIPAVLATVWVCFHKAQIQPTNTAKSIALVGIVIHFFSMPPPSFWDMHVLEWFVSKHPCPLHFMSVFDVILCVTFIGSFFLFAFVVLEYKRNVLLMLEDRMKKTNQILQEETRGYMTPGRYGAVGGTSTPTHGHRSTTPTHGHRTGPPPPSTMIHGNAQGGLLNTSHLSDDSLSTINKSGPGSMNHLQRWTPKQTELGKPRTR